MPDSNHADQTQRLENQIVRTLLCDADGNLFPSEEPAYEASVGVTNRMLEAIGAPQRYEAQELRRATTGKNFRALASELARRNGTPLADDALDRWVTEEKRAVSDHLRAVLEPDPEALAIEDSASGVLSAVSAGVPTVGNVRFVAADEREERVKELVSTGALAVVSSWRALEKLLGQQPPVETLS